MANYTITTANVAIAESNVRTTVVQVGEAVTEGTAVYLDTTTSKFMLADATDATKANIAGVIISPAALDGYALLQTTKKYIAGTTLVAGDPVYLSATAGGGNLCPHADLIATNYVTLIGHAVSTTEVELDLQVTGVAKA
jgi:hypothetical protein